jgi:hypothetical protein
MDCILGEQRSFRYCSNQPSLSHKKYRFNLVTYPPVSFFFVLYWVRSLSLKKIMLNMLHVKRNFYQAVFSITNGIGSMLLLTKQQVHHQLQHVGYLRKK